MAADSHRRLAAGDGTTALLDSQGRLWVTGSNVGGRLGNGTTRALAPREGNAFAPVRATGPAAALTFVSVAGRLGTFFALTAAGDLYGWGENDAGEVGDGLTADVPEPKLVRASITAVAAGEGRALAIDDQGAVLEWGSGLTGAPTAVAGLPSGFTPVAVAQGLGHSLVLGADGTLWGWGDNSVGQLGNGLAQTTWTTPQQVLGPGGAPLGCVRAIAAGESFSVVLDDAGAVRTWGANGLGQLGDGTTTQRSNPTPVTLSQPVARISAGRAHVLAVDTAGAAWAWGSDSHGQLGAAAADCGGQCAYLPAAVDASGATLADAVAGREHSAALATAGGFLAFGFNATGQRGDGTPSGTIDPLELPRPTYAFGGHVPVDVFARSEENYRNVVLRMDDGTLWAFGRNPDTTLGTTASGSSPALVGGLVGQAITSVCTGGFYALAVDAAGGLWARGESSAGALGQGPSGPTTTTTWLQVTFPEAGVVVRRALCLPSTAYALDDAGGVWAWGDDTRGALGNGAGGSTNAPARVLGVGGTGTLTGVVDLAAAVGGGASAHVIAALSSGNVATWGEDTNGVLGHASTGCLAGISCTELPALVCGPGTVNRSTCDAGSNLLTGVTRVSAGLSVHLALAGGAVYAWGNDNYGKLGRGTDAVAATIPVAAGAITGTVTELHSGRDFHLALTSEGDVWAWGSNRYGQLGLGSQAVTCSHGACATTPQKVTALDAETITKLGAGPFNAIALASGGAVWSWGRNENGELGTQSAGAVGGGALGALAPARVVLAPE